MRMVQAPVGLKMASFEEVSGPTLLGSSSSNTKHIQNTVDPFGLWTFNVSYPVLRGGMARAFEKWRTSLLAGGNCTRLVMRSMHEPTYSELGLNSSETEYENNQFWSNGEPFSNGRIWSIGKPLAVVAASAFKDESVITLDISNWNGVVPAWFGIVGHFAAYKVIGEDVSNNTARLKVFPPIRKDISTGGYATLRPTMCVTLTGEGATGKDEGRFLTGASLKVREVLHETVENYVTEGF